MLQRHLFSHGFTPPLIALVLFVAIVTDAVLQASGINHILIPLFHLNRMQILFLCSVEILDKFVAEFPNTCKFF